jgi:hypothetical protein
VHVPQRGHQELSATVDYASCGGGYGGGMSHGSDAPVLHQHRLIRDHPASAYIDDGNPGDGERSRRARRGELFLAPENTHCKQRHHKEHDSEHAPRGGFQEDLHHFLSAARWQWRREEKVKARIR